MAATWLRVHSPAKAPKESGMNSRFSQRFEQGLSQIKESLAKKSGIKNKKKYGNVLAGSKPNIQAFINITI